MIHILHLEDNPADAELIEAKLDEAGLDYRITLVEGRDEFEHALSQDPLDIILADYRLPGYDGMSALEQARELWSDIPFIFVSGTMGEEAAIDALTRGATDYVLKHNLSRLVPAVRRALKEARSQRERKEAEQRLHLLNFALNNVREAAFLFDENWRLSFVNDESCRSLGYAREELLDLPVTDVDPDFSKENGFGLWPELKAQGGLNFESRHKTKDGRVFPVEISANYFEYNRKGYILALVRDITERKESEKRLRESERRYRSLVENYPDFFVRLGTDLRFKYVNPAVTRAFGYRLEDFVGKKLSELPPNLPSNQNEILEGKVREVIDTGIKNRLEVKWPTLEGERYFEIFHIPEKDEKGAILSVLGVTRDITDRKRAEQERAAHLDYFRNTDRINRAIQGADNLDQMMIDVLDIVLSVFDCERAFLMYPCDPESPTWTSPMERNKPEYPGVLDLKIELPMDSQVAETLRILLAAEGPVTFGPGMMHAQPEDVAEQFGIRSFMAMAIYPNIGRPWQFGIHQCSHDRIWTTQEMRMFETVGRRLADALSSLLSHRDLHENEEFLDKVVEHIPDMIFIKDAQNLSFVRFNKAGEELLGIQREEMIGKNDYDFFPKEEADFFTQKDRQVLDSKEPLDIPEEIVSTEYNQERILHTKKIPILDETGEPQYLLGISEDITDRKQAEASIRKLSQAIEQSPVSIVITDLEGAIEFVNARFSQITGYTFDEARGQNPKILQSGETPTEVYEKLWDTICSGGVWHGELRNRKKNGDLFWELATIAPIRDADNVISHYVAVKEDITERKVLEEQFRKVQKMEAIGQLAGGIAHDFNNILSAITGYTELSRSLITPKSKVSEYLSEVMKASMRAKDLINQILMFSRETDLELKPIQLSLPVKEALKLIRASVPATIEIRSRIASNASALADPTQIHQIVMNLCTNAAHAMREAGGLLEVNLTDICIDATSGHKDYPDAQSGDYIKLSVADQGHGIESHILRRIFDPFFTTKGKGEGTGMGLSVIHGIIISYGGYVYAHSRPGEGSTFDVLIPSLESSEPADLIKETPVPKGSESILFVDDEKMIVDIGKHMLESLGYRVVAEESAFDALESFRNDPDGFDLVISDMIMPKMTGLDLAEKLIEIRPDIPIILCTGFGVSLEDDNFSRHGIRDIIFKPILRRDIATSIRKVMDEK